ncbi:MAG: hypothetical protein QXM37_04380 [Candidatus Bathyarchaeia archaeon]
MAEAEEYEVVTLKLPKGMVELLRLLGEDPEDYLSWAVMEAIKADLAELQHSPLVNFRGLVEKFNLKKVLEGV